MISNDFVLKRDSTAENAAVEGIISLFTDKWDETSKKSSREITALVLMQIRDACIVVPKGEETEESAMLKHVNNYLDKTIEQLQSNKPLQMVISGSTLEDIIKNIENIRAAAMGEEFEKDIKNRLAVFISKLNHQIEQIQSAQGSRKKRIIIYSLLAGIAMAIGILFVGPGREYIDVSTFIFSAVCCSAVCFGAFSQIIK